MRKGFVVLGYIVLVLVAALFLMQGFSKVTGADQTVASFEKYGYAIWFRVLLGMGEIAAAIALFIPALSRYAASLLAMIMVGAIITHFVNGEAGYAALPAALLIITGITAFVRKPKRAFS
ncbi:DoxX family protein [Paenibacillus sp. TAB 01]|uniref:DoxX family protein n=1 Tax=Paenibacillus sp. TAB 01 TaxID=3368988 RepID=UPI003752A9AC